MDSLALVTTIIFLLTYALIVAERIPRTLLALVAAAVVLMLRVLSQEEAVGKIDFNTIGLLVGMMIIVNITKRTGLFEYLAMHAAKLSRGEPMRIMAALSLITAVISALLDNVTTVLLVAPVTFSITAALKLNPVPFLIAQIISSNIGGTATLIGDPPNIMIGSAVGLSFMDFVNNEAAIVAFIEVVTMGLIYLIYRKQMVVPEHLKLKILKLHDRDVIKDRKLLAKSLIVLGLTITGFILHEAIHFQPATIALTGAAFLLLISKVEHEEILHEIEWSTLFFFMGLFILVGALEKVGVIRMVAEGALKMTGGNLLLSGMLILWLSAIASAFIDNIPFVATMIPLIKAMGDIGGIDVGPLWWALSLGACLGGNGTLIGASANVVVAGISGRHGYPITFRDYLKIGFPLMLVSIVISTVYMYFRYFQ